MNELDICTICNNKDIEPTVCISCWSSNYEKGALEELKKFKNEIELVENRHMRQKLIHNITDRIKELKKFYEERELND